MGEPVTVSADLLPGLLRPGCQIIYRDEAGVIGAVWDDGTATLLQPRWLEGTTYNSLHGEVVLRSGPIVRPVLAAPISDLVLDLTTPTGWDAAVGALARHHWSMEPHERAVFFWDGWLWRLDPPRRIKEDSAWVGWGVDVPPPWEPYKALRFVLHHVAGMPITPLPPPPQPR